MASRRPVVRFHERDNPALMKIRGSRAEALAHWAFADALSESCFGFTGVAFDASASFAVPS